jgi:hypothetical protein
MEGRRQDGKSEEDRREAGSDRRVEVSRVPGGVH